MPAEKYGADTSYQFGGLLGTLDHVLANEVASGTLADAQVWNINADEPVAFEYSRRNYNAVDFYDDSPFRASDHDPVKVGFTLGEDESTDAPSGDDQDDDNTNGPGFGFGSSSLGTAAIIGFAILAGLLAIPGFMAATGNLQKIIPAGIWGMLPQQAKDFITRLNK